MGGTINIIIAVMELRRQPYLLKFKKDNEVAVAKKIKKLQMAAEQQRHQVASLNNQDTIPPPPLQEAPPPQHPVPTASARTVKLPINQATPTARKPQKCQDLLQTENSLNLQEERQAQRLTKPPLPIIKIPGNEEQDKRLEYLVSDEYNKYLEKLQGGGKVEQAKALKEKFNNNIYLGKKDRKQYIQDIIKTKDVLPRVNLQFLREEPITKAPREISRGRGQLVDSYMYNEREVREVRSIRQAAQLTRREMEQESPIKRVNIQFDTENKKEYISNNVTIMLSPVCQKNQFVSKQKQPAAKQKQMNDITLFFHNHYNGIDMPKPNNSPNQSKPHTPRGRPFKHETFRKQLEYCQKGKHVSGKEPKEQYKQQQSSNRGKKNKQNKQNYYKKRPPTPSPSPSSSSSRQEPQNIYDISFKIDMPKFTKRQYTPSPQIIKRPTIKPQQIQYLNYNMHTPPQNCSIYKHTYYPQKPRIYTEHTYSPYHLQYSQASSSTTRTSHQGQPRNSHSPHKMSVISRSKHRRGP